MRNKSTKNYIQMDNDFLAICLLKVITKQRFLGKQEKKYMIDNCYITEKGNITSKGKDFVWNYYGNSEA